MEEEDIGDRREREKDRERKERGLGSTVFFCIGLVILPSGSAQYGKVTAHRAISAIANGHTKNT